MAKSLYIVIVGCGRAGGSLANTLSASGHRIVVIDRKEIAFDKLAVEFSGFKIMGDASELDVLRQAKIQQANYLFATTTSDNINLMVAQIARAVFNVAHVVARVYDPAREALYREFDIATISPTKLTASAFLEVIKQYKDEL